VARTLWKLKLGIAIILLLIIIQLIALFPLKIVRFEKVTSREVTLSMFWEKMPLIGRFFPPPVEIMPEEQPTYQLQVVAQQRKELEGREKRFEQDMERLAKVKEDLNEQRRELKKIRDELEVLIGAREKMTSEKTSEKDRVAAAQLAQLAKSYEKMDPAAAAKAFDEMDVDDVIRVMTKMRDKYVSRIIEAMEPKRAAKVSTGMINK